MMEDKLMSYQAFVNQEQNREVPSYECEQHLYYRIKNGDPEAMDAFHRMWGKKKLAPQRDGSLLGEQFGAISVITMVTRTMISGGMDEGDSYDMDAFFTEKIKQVHSAEEVEQVLSQMITHCIAVMSQKEQKIRETYSSRIVKCINYVHYHLHDKLYLTEMAEKLGVSPSYLATQFKRETGMTLMEYISEKKMENARAMLRYSDLSIIEISDLFGYSSQSHFTKVFREKYQMTPKQFRDAFHETDEFTREKA